MRQIALSAMWLFIPLLLLLVALLGALAIMPGAMTMPRAWLIFIVLTAIILISYLIFRRSKGCEGPKNLSEANKIDPQAIKIVRLVLGILSIVFAFYDFAILNFFSEIKFSKTSAALMSIFGHYGSVFFYLLCSVILLRIKNK